MLRAHEVGVELAAGGHGIVDRPASEVAEPLSALGLLQRRDDRLEPLLGRPAPVDVSGPRRLGVGIGEVPERRHVLMAGRIGLRPRVGEPVLPVAAVALGPAAPGDDEPAERTIERGVVMGIEGAPLACELQRRVRVAMGEIGHTRDGRREGVEQMARAHHPLPVRRPVVGKVHRLVAPALEPDPLVQRDGGAAELGLERAHVRQPRQDVVAVDGGLCVGGNRNHVGERRVLGDDDLDRHRAARELAAAPHQDVARLAAVDDLGARQLDALAARQQPPFLGNDDDAVVPEHDVAGLAPGQRRVEADGTRVVALGLALVDAEEGAHVVVEHEVVGLAHPAAAARRAGDEVDEALGSDIADVARGRACRQRQQLDVAELALRCGAEALATFDQVIGTPDLELEARPRERPLQVADGQLAPQVDGAEVLPDAAIAEHDGHIRPGDDVGMAVAQLVQDGELAAQALAGLQPVEGSAAHGQERLHGIAEQDDVVLADAVRPLRLHEEQRQRRLASAEHQPLDVGRLHQRLVVERHRQAIEPEVAEAVDVGRRLQRIRKAEAAQRQAHDRAREALGRVPAPLVADHALEQVLECHAVPRLTVRQCCRLL